jgi:hypothetical protein
MTEHTHRCGYCGNPGDPGRCTVCDSSMEDEARAIEGARTPRYIYRWLASRDHAWQIVEQLKQEKRNAQARSD